MPGSTTSVQQDSAEETVAASIFFLDVEEFTPVLAACERLLIPSEQQRASRLPLPLARQRFTVGRAALRTQLARRLGISPQTVPIVYGPAGKPMLGPTAPALWFSVAHSHHLIVLAISTAGPIGVDVEMQDNPPPDITALARIPFDTENLAPTANPAEFYRRWVHFEASRKLSGAGIFAADPPVAPPAFSHAFSLLTPSGSYAGCVATAAATRIHPGTWLHIPTMEPHAAG